MTLFAVLAVIGIIIAISRYNEDDNLFWKLFVAFIGSIVAATVYTNVIDSKKSNNTVMIEKVPTQGLESVPYLFGILADTSLTTPQREKSPKPVSKDMPFNNNKFIAGKVFAEIRGRPQQCMYFDTS